jgi:predicted nucleic acid-binding protein
VSRVFIDTNIFYNILFETDLTGEARRLIESYEESRLYTSLTVVNELLYVSTRKYYRDRGLVGGSYGLRRLVAREGYPGFIVEGIRGLLDELEVEVLADEASYREVLEAARALRLLPSDAIIALTCRYNNIDVIITFDNDFKRVPWLRAVP